MNFETGMQETESPLTSFQKMEHLGRSTCFQNWILRNSFAGRTREGATLRAGRTVCVEGQAPCILSLYSGEMRILLAGAPGALINAGECVGLLELLRRRPSPSHAWPSNPVCVDDRKGFISRGLEEHASICLGILETFAEKLDTQNGSLFDAQKSVFTC